MTEYTLDIRTYEPVDPRLGRHVRHDSRSLMYQVAPQPRSAMVSKRHYSMIPTLDQGQLGSCTGNAATKNMSYGEFWSAQGDTVLSTTDSSANQSYAVEVYAAATAIDPWDGTYPPTDTGSDGLSVAKIMHQRGLISGYKHATSLDAVLTALQTQPVITGTAWYEGMYDVESDGRIRPTGEMQGGHEYTLDEVDMENGRVWLQNSWGPRWGIDGRAYLTFEDYRSLLADWGDATIFVPITEPAPEPAVVETSSADAELARAASSWLSTSPFFYKKTIQASLKQWLDRKNL